MAAGWVYTINLVLIRLDIMKKAILHVLVSGCLFSMAGAATAAADTGNIKFIGDITTSACAIGGGQQGADMTVTMGSIPTHMFQSVGDRSPETDFTITLIGCDTSVSDTAEISFTPGAGSVINSRLLSLENASGATGVAVGLAEANGQDIVVGGSAVSYSLLDGTNVLNFKAFYEATAATVTAGAANARAVFAVAYP